MKKIESNLSFYTAISKDYDSYMTDSDKRARQIVAKLFSENVPSGNVLDFGGGTGLDIPWLNHNNYYIYFMEPSTGMREVAKEKSSSISNGLNFIDKNVHFTDWKSDSLPFEEKMNGVLANFAVLNCIENLQSFFEKMEMIADKSCRLIITIIDPRFKMILKNHSPISAFRIESLRKDYIQKEKQARTSYKKFNEKFKIYQRVVSNECRVIKGILDPNAKELHDFGIIPEKSKSRKKEFVHLKEISQNGQNE